MRSLRHCGLIVAFAAGLTAVTAGGQEEKKGGQDKLKGSGVAVAPAWKLDAPFGQKWETTATQTVTVTNKADNKSKKATYEHTIVMDVTWTPDKVAGGSTKQKFTLKVNAVSVSSKVTVDGGTADTATVAGAKEDPRVPAAAAAAALKGIEIPVTVDTERMTAEVDAAELSKRAEKAAEKATGTAEKGAVRAALARDALAYQIAAALPALPKKDAPTKLPARTIKGAYGDYLVEAKYDLDKDADGKLTLKPSATWTFTPAAATVAGAKVEKVDPPKVVLDGEATFDPAAGLTATLKTKPDTKQTFTLTVGKDTYEAVVAIDYTTKVTPTQSPMQK
jgi:hypothetical protein